MGTGKVEIGASGGSPDDDDKTSSERLENSHPDDSERSPEGCRSGEAGGVNALCSWGSGLEVWDPKLLARRLRRGDLKRKRERLRPADSDPNESSSREAESCLNLGEEGEPSQANRWRRKEPFEGVLDAADPAKEPFSGVADAASSAICRRAFDRGQVLPEQGFRFRRGRIHRGGRHEGHVGGRMAAVHSRSRRADPIEAHTWRKRHRLWGARGRCWSIGYHVLRGRSFTAATAAIVARNVRETSLNPCHQGSLVAGLWGCYLLPGGGVREVIDGGRRGRGRAPLIDGHYSRRRVRPGLGIHNQDRHIILI
eukprot:scaffold74722_cov48-Attheya_sp.AAC.1